MTAVLIRSRDQDTDTHLREGREDVRDRRVRVAICLPRREA